jgi:hypothetical protein
MWRAESNADLSASCNPHRISGLYLMNFNSENPHWLDPALRDLNAVLTHHLLGFVINKLRVIQWQFRHSINGGHLELKARSDYHSWIHGMLCGPVGWEDVCTK